jgi:hypothetical protein
LVQVIVVPALTVTIAGENAKFWIATALVATGASWPDAAVGLPPAGIDIPGMACSATTGAGPAAPGAAAVVGLVRIPTAIAAPARVAIPAAAAGSARLVVNWRMMIEPSRW